MWPSALDRTFSALAGSLVCHRIVLNSFVAADYNLPATLCRNLTVFVISSHNDGIRCIYIMYCEYYMRCFVDYAWRCVSFCFTMCCAGLYGCLCACYCVSSIACFVACVSLRASLHALCVFSCVYFIARVSLHFVCFIAMSRIFEKHNVTNHETHAHSKTHTRTHLHICAAYEDTQQLPTYYEVHQQCTCAPTMHVWMPK